jgi:LmbE family N-acetylglucosaminyl deacetylase
MTHLFVSPHADDVALSCGGLIARLRERGESVSIATLYGGAGPLPELTPYQREALGFGDRPLVVRPADAMSVRVAEDETYAGMMDAQLVLAPRPDAIFRGYESEEQLFGPARADDILPTKGLTQALELLGSETAYLPLSLGGHVDHRLVHQAGVRELGHGRERRTPCRLAFYEDFPYAGTMDFQSLDQLPEWALVGLAPELALTPEYVQIADLLDAKIDGIRAYASQVDRLFGSDAQMVAAVRDRAARVGLAGGVGPAERIWHVAPKG